MSHLQFLLLSSFIFAVYIFIFYRIFWPRASKKDIQKVREDFAEIMKEQLELTKTNHEAILKLFDRTLELAKVLEAGSRASLAINNRQKLILDHLGISIEHGDRVVKTKKL